MLLLNWCRRILSQQSLFQVPVSFTANDFGRIRKKYLPHFKLCLCDANQLRQVIMVTSSRWFLTIFYIQSITIMTCTGVYHTFSVEMFFSSTIEYIYVTQRAFVLVSCEVRTMLFYTENRFCYALKTLPKQHHEMNWKIKDSPVLKQRFNHIY